MVFIHGCKVYPVFEKYVAVEWGLFMDTELIQCSKDK